MTLMLDPEPTLAASVEDETQSLHAWSQEDTATEVVDYWPRSWRTPLILVAVAIAALTAVGVWTMRPQPAPTPVVSAPKPQVAPLDPVARYAELYRSRGGRIFPGHEQAAADEARNVCVELASKTPGDEINDIMASSPGFNRYYAGVVTNTAIDVFCPQYNLGKK